MKKILMYAGMISAMLIVAGNQTKAQNWLTAGNGASATQFLGTQAGTSTSFDLRIRTNNVQRMVIKASNGRVGVGITNPAGKLHVQGGNGANDTIPVINAIAKKLNLTYDAQAVHGESVTTPGWGIGVDGVGNFIGVNGFGAIGVAGFSQGADTTAANTGTLIGVDGEVNIAHLGVGVFGAATNCWQNIGVWGVSTDTAGFQADPNPNMAGYFQGDVLGWRVWQFSDGRYKNNVQTIKGALDKVMQLNPTTYTFNRANSLKLPGGNQIGFIAEQLEQVFPELIKHTILPTGITRGANGKLAATDEVNAKVVNYMGLIPVLTAAIQEQKQAADLKDAQIADLNARLTALEAHLSETSSAKLSSTSLTAASLEQNNPNPFNQSTQIRYSVPANYNTAQIIITSVDGKSVRTYNVTGSGKGQITLNANELSAGTYNYSLNVDGKTVDTKSLVLTK